MFYFTKRLFSCFILLLLLPVQAGADVDSKTYVNKAWGYSIEYPGDYLLINDPEVIKVFAQEGAREAFKDSADEQLLDEMEKVTGYQFILMCPPVEGEPPVANLNLVIEQVAQPGVTNQQYFQAAVSVLPKLNAEITTEPRVVTLQGRQFYSLDYTLPNQPEPITGRVYVHYDAGSRTAFALTIAGNLESGAEEFRTLEAVLETFTIQDADIENEGNVGLTSR
jgi:hypothetical protein